MPPSPAVRSYYYRSKFLKKRRAAQKIQVVYRRYTVQKRFKELRKNSLLLCNAIKYHLASKKLKVIREKLEKDMSEAVTELQNGIYYDYDYYYYFWEDGKNNNGNFFLAIRHHVAFQRLDRIRRMREAKMLLEEQEKKRAEEEVYDAAVRRLKFKERSDQFKNQGQAPASVEKDAPFTPLHAGIRMAEDPGDPGDLSLFGDFDLDASDPKAFALQDYALNHFTDEILSSGHFSKKKPIGHLKRLLPTPFTAIAEQRKEVALLCFKCKC